MAETAKAATSGDRSAETAIKVAKRLVRRVKRINSRAMSRGVLSEESIHRNLHPELHPILLEFHRINEHPLKAVWHVYTDECLDKIVLEFERNSLMVEAEPNDDGIIFHVIHNNDRDTNGWIDSSRSEVWRHFIGEPFGWGWITINQQDFLDGVLLSFGGITPQVMLNVMASSIKESLISERSS